MKKQIGFRIIVLLLIGVMLILSCHTHPQHFSCGGEDDHCLLCQVLHSGFTYTPSFELILLLTIIELITLLPVFAIKLFHHTGCDGRAPPVNLLFN
jgi:ABC-type cobalt transport system substrate-binding protein